VAGAIAMIANSAAMNTEQYLDWNTLDRNAKDGKAIVVSLQITAGGMPVKLAFGISPLQQVEQPNAKAVIILAAVAPGTKFQTEADLSA
jgi:hypothetical protein